MRICFYNSKGGAGKSSTALGLGAALAELGRRVLLVDVDPQGSLASFSGVDPTGRPTVAEMIENSPRSRTGIPASNAIQKTNIDRVSLLPSSRHLVRIRSEVEKMPNREMILDRLLEPLTDHFDDFLIDSPGDEGLYSMMAVYASERILIPTSLSAMELTEVRRSIVKVADLDHAYQNIKSWEASIVINRYDARTSKTNQEGFAEIEKILREEGFEDPRESGLILESKIRDATEVKNAQLERRSVFQNQRRHSVCKDYESLASELVGLHP